MEVSNAGLYDGSTAAAEAALMACRITGRDRISVLSTVNPRYRRVIETYASGRDIQLNQVEPDLSNLPSDSACLIVQQPNFFGYLEEVDSYASRIHEVGALFIVIVDPISLGMFKPPGDYGADVVVAEGQPLGSPLSFGGHLVDRAMLLCVTEMNSRQEIDRLVEVLAKL